MAIAVALGLVALWLVLLSHGNVYTAAARQLPARRYWYGIVELAFSAVGMAGWYGLWPTPQSAGGRWKHGLGWTFGFLAATNLLYHFPPLFAILGVLSTRPEMWGSGRHFTSLLSDAEVLARTAHHGLASFVAAGVALAAVASRMARSGGDISAFGKACILGGRIALVAALVQVPAGAYLLAKLSSEERLQLLRNSPAASAIFALSLAAWFVLILRLLALSGGDVERRTIRSCLVWMILVVILMVFVRHLSRHDALRRAGTRVAWCGSKAPLLATQKRANYSNPESNHML
jgi:hypothetical protein